MYIKVHVVPGAKKERVEKESDTVYRMFVKEPAERNLANGRVRELLGEIYGLPKGKVHMVTGHRSTAKILDVDML